MFMFMFVKAAPLHLLLGLNPFYPRVIPPACDYAKPEMESCYIAALREGLRNPGGTIVSSISTAGMQFTVLCS
jgi:hypothetical protein